MTTPKLHPRDVQEFSLGGSGKSGEELHAERLEAERLALWRVKGTRAHRTRVPVFAEPGERFVIVRDLVTRTGWHVFEFVHSAGEDPRPVARWHGSTTAKRAAMEFVARALADRHRTPPRTMADVRADAQRFRDAHPMKECEHPAHHDGEGFGCPNCARRVTS